MRGAVDGLPVPYPIGPFLPGIYQEDDFTARWLSALDDVLAPAVASLECLEAYLDPRLAPRDFLHWLAGWVGAVTDENWDDGRQRHVVLDAVVTHRYRGTLVGLRMLLEMATAGRVQIVDAGGIGWSTTPGADFADPTRPLQIRVAVPDPSTISRAALEELVYSAKPAHVRHELEVVSDDHL